VNPLQELLNGEVQLSSERVREATAAAIHAFRHDRRLERLDVQQTFEVTHLLFQSPDIRTLVRYTLPVTKLEEAVEAARGYMNQLIFEVVVDDAIADEGVRQIQRVLAVRGGQMRLAEVPFRAHIYNCRFALVAADFDNNLVGAIALSEPDLLTSLTELHARLWRHGRKWEGAARSRVDLADVLADVLAGGTDEVSAQRLHVSLRTYRRKVQELVDLLGTESRFQAGAVAEQRRYLELVRPETRPLAATPDPYLEALAQVRYRPG
jgi:hypothetical protein